MNSYYYLGNLNNLKIRERENDDDDDNRFVIIPVGSTEQHGNHLPFYTDTIIAEKISLEVCKQISGLVLPAVSFGVSFEHLPLLNISLKHSTLTVMLRDICESLISFGIKKILIINGHHGNMGVLQYIAQDVLTNLSNRDKKIGIYSLNYWKFLDNEFDHGGEVETSLLLAIAPELVDMNSANGSQKEFGKSKEAYNTLTNIPGSFLHLTGNGIWGNPCNATKEKGELFLKTIVQRIVKTTKELDIF